MCVKSRKFATALWMCAAAFMVVSSEGWKPIPPPPGIYSLKTSFPIRGASSEHMIFHEHGLDHHSNEPQEITPDDDLHKHQKFDIYTTAEDANFPKDNFKSLKPPIPIFKRERKRPWTSYASFNSFVEKKPSKAIYYDKPDITKDAIKYVKPFKTSYHNEDKYRKALSFGGNDVAPYLLHNVYDDHCPLYKVSFRQDLHYQDRQDFYACFIPLADTPIYGTAQENTYVQYKVHMPDLKEFTICLWSKFHNHSYDHPLFSYAVRHQPKAIYMWVSNTERSNYYNMKINGHPIFRLNYPIRLNKWYHTCQSWNAKTGEWQVWVNAERIGRGFHNLLVGHVIPGGGIAISGQEQLQYGGGFLEGIDRPKAFEGLLGEMTMFQLYRIALTAGKAYTDHRHHHSHYTSTTPEPADLSTEEESLPPPEHPFLENGQLKRPLKVFELAESLRPKGNDNADDVQNQPTFTDFFDGHLGQNYYYLPFGGHYGNSISLIPYSEHSVFKRNDASKNRQTKKETVESGEDEEKKKEKVKFFKNPSAPVHVERIKFNSDKGAYRNIEIGDPMDWSYRIHRSKRTTNATAADNFAASTDEEETDTKEEEERTGREMIFGRRRPMQKNHAVAASESKHAKRVLLPHRKKNVRHFTRKESTEEEESNPKKVIVKKQVILEDFHFRPVIVHEFSYPHILDGHYHGDVNQEEKESEDDSLRESGEDNEPAQPEPAEEEVRRIMSVCSGCEGDPYRKVAVISWRLTPKKLYSGALFLRARAECRKF